MRLAISKDRRSAVRNLAGEFNCILLEEKRFTSGSLLARQEQFEQTLMKASDPRRKEGPPLIEQIGPMNEKRRATY